MSKVLKFIIGFIFLAGIGYGLFYFSGVMTKPTAVQISSYSANISPVPQEFLFLDLTEKTKDLVKNGEIPVIVNGDELGRDDPFAGF